MNKFEELRSRLEDISKALGEAHRNVADLEKQVDGVIADLYEAEDEAQSD